MARSYPVNLACRDAVIGLSGFDTYEEVASRFTQDAAVPYSYKGEVYGLPATQAYFMFFYRTDILEELGLKAPDTWDEFCEMDPHAGTQQLRDRDALRPLRGRRRAGEGSVR